MKPLVIYHDNCADGFGAAFAAWLKLGDEAEYLPMKYGQFTVGQLTGEMFKPYELENQVIYILDFSFPREVMDHLFTHANRVVWLDHHKTAFEMWCGKYEKGVEFTDCPNGHDVVLNDNKSGAMLAWEYFHPGEEVPMLFKHIDDYDRWQFKLDSTKEFMKALWSHAPWTFEQWKKEMLRWGEYGTSWGELQYASAIREGAAILRAHEQNVQSVVEGGARKCCITKYNTVGDICFQVVGLAANCPPHLASDVGHELANQSGTYGLLWYINKDGKCLCSLRSNGNYDVSAIAKSFGGGGHKNAAGFETEITTLLGWIR